MNKSEQVDSPFLQEKPVRLGFGIMVMLLLMVIAAGAGLLVFLAIQVPAITSEFNAWMGRTNSDVSLEDARWAQLVFATFLYSAPMLLGLFAYGLHFVVNKVDTYIKTRQHNDEDDEFRME